MRKSNKENTKYVIYYRVSTGKQGQSGLGLESQKTYIHHFINESDIAKEFTDIQSGGDRDRAGLNKAIALCVKNGYTLAVAKIDRLSRKTEDALEIYNKLEQRLFSCDIPSLDKFSLTLFMAIADRERELIKIRTKAALAAKKARGEKMGTTENLTKEGRAKAHKANRAKADTNKNNVRVMELCSMYRANGLTLQQVADKLNEQGHKTPSGKGSYQKTMVSRLLKRYERLQVAS